ncbi:hypothetical protein R1flu_015106 [Riccia fluitans]|uniref:Fe2OG dioxygenase domain-containing protein n=1 Tax=Riccia fluitans TaxID=41844 RepID=A0ABD1YID9_9MARC
MTERSKAPRGCQGGFQMAIDTATDGPEVPFMKSGTMVPVSQQKHLITAEVDVVPEEWKVSLEDRPEVSTFEYIDIPSIDLSLLETDRAELVRRLRTTATDWGICRLINHGISPELMKEVETQGMKFFGQSSQEKLKLLKHGNGNAYYTGINTEERRHSLHWAESFVMKFGLWKTLDLDAINGCTIDWATADDNFRKSLLEFMIGLKSLSEKILQLFAESLGLKADFYSDILESGGLASRWNYYPVCPEPGEVLGAHSHTDPNFLTILQQDKVGGLQVEKDGRWYNVQPMEGTLVLNIGDLFQIWTNGIFKSVLHRVLVNGSVSRISVAWLLYPRSSQSLSPPEELVDEKHPRMYRELMVEEYHQKVLTERLARQDSKVFNGQNLIDSLTI